MNQFQLQNKQIVVLLNTSDYRGDHSADIQYSYLFDENTTLKEVIMQIKPNITDTIVIPPRGKIDGI